MGGDIAQTQEKYQKVAKSPIFESFILATIMLSCIMMAIQDPSVEDSKQPIFITVTVDCINVIFFMEMCLKLFAFGATAYFRDTWNWIDFVVVCEGVISSIFQIVQAANPHQSLQGNAGLGILKILRALRPLRTAQYFPPMKLLIRTLGVSIPDTGALCIVIAITIFFFASTGIIYFHDRLSYRCKNLVTQTFVSNDTVCGKSGLVSCSSGQSCEYYGQNPNDGWTSFDSFGRAMVTTFTVFALEGWTDITFYLQDAVSSYAWLFTIILAVLSQGIFFNLFPAILTTKFYRTLQVQKEIEARKRKLLEARREDRQTKGVINSKFTKNSSVEWIEEPDMEDEKDDFKKIIARFDEAEKADLALIRNTMNDKTKAVRDPLIQQYGKLPFLTPPCNLCAELRYHIGQEMGGFSLFIYFCILLNVLFLSIETYPENARQKAVEAYANWVFTMVFLVEMAIKLLVFGPVSYCLDMYNVMDGVITILTAASLVVKELHIVILLRPIRIVKFLSIARAGDMKKIGGKKNQKLNPIMNLPRIMNVIKETSAYIIYLYFLMSIMVFIFALAGRQYFHKVDNFATFGLAVVTIFKIITGDKWDETMYSTMKLQGLSAALFFILWYIISKLFILSFVTAIVIYYVDMDGREYLTFVARGTTVATYRMEAALNKIMLKIQWKKFVSTTTNTPDTDGKVDLIEEEPPAPEESCLRNFWITENSLGIFAATNPFRTFCKKFVDHSIFQTLMMLGIIASAVTMTIEVDLGASNQPISEKQSMVGEVVDEIVTIMFVFELLLYSIADGFLLTSKSYLKGGFSNVLDFFITLLSLLSLIFSLMGADFIGSANSAIKVIRLMRVFRVLRLATKSRVTRLILGSVVTSAPAVGFVVLIVSVVVVVFSIVGQKLFIGKFFYCNDPTFPIGEDLRSVAAGFPQGCTIVKSAQLNFNRFSDALLSSMMVFAQDGFAAPLQSAYQATGQYKQPDLTPGNARNIFTAFYWVFFLGLIVLLTPIFVGVQYGTFLYSIYVDGNLKKRIASIKDAEWAVYKMKLSFIKPETSTVRPENFRRMFYDLIHSTVYQVFIAMVVVGHSYLRVGPYFNDIQDFIFKTTAHFDATNPGILLNLLATVMYVIDTLVFRFIGLGFYGTFIGVLNVIDWGVTLLLVLEITIGNFNYWPQDYFWVIEILRAVILLRIMKVLNSLARTRFMFSVVCKTLSSVLSVTGLIVIITYIYSVFGCLYLRGYAIKGISDTLTEHIRFSSTANGMLILARVATTDEWSLPMLGLGADIPAKWQWALYLYFCSYLILTKFVLVNMFLLIILQKFEIHSDYKTGLAMGQIKAFKDAWHEKDKRGTGSILLHELPSLMQKLGSPLGSAMGQPRIEATRIAQKIYYWIAMSEVNFLDSRDSGNPRVKKKKERARRKEKERKKATKASGSYAGLKDDGRLEIVVDGGGSDDNTKSSWRIPGSTTTDGCYLDSPVKKALGEVQEDPLGHLTEVEREAWSHTPRDIMAKQYADYTVDFDDVIVAAHYIAIFGLQLPDEATFQAKRKLAQDYIALIRETVQGYVRKIRSKDKTLEDVAIESMTDLERHNIKAYRARMPVALAIAVDRWAVNVNHDVGYDERAHLEATHLLAAHTYELDQTALQLRLLEAASKERSDDETFYKPQIQDLKKMKDSLEKSQRILKEIRVKYVDVIWQLDSIDLVQQFRVPKANINAVALTPQSDLLFIADSNGCIRYFRRKEQILEAEEDDDNQEGPPRKNFKFLYVDEVKQESAVLCIAVSPDGKKFFTAGKDNYIRSWVKELSAGEMKKDGRKLFVRYKPYQIMQGHKGEVYSMEIYDSLLLSCGADGYVRMWRIAGDTCILSAEISNVAGRNKNLFFRPSLFCMCVFDDPDHETDGAYIVVGAGDGAVAGLTFRTDTNWITNTTNWKPTATLAAHTGRAITAIKYAWDRLYTAASDGMIKMWEIEYMREGGLKTGIKDFKLHVSLAVHSGPVSSLCFTGGVLFSASHDMSVVPFLKPERLPDPRNPSKYILKQETRGGSINHTGAITSMCGTSNLLVTADVAGGVIFRMPRDTQEITKVGVGARPKDHEEGEEKRSHSMKGSSTHSPRNSPKAKGSISLSLSSSRNATRAFNLPGESFLPKPGSKKPLIDGLNISAPDFLGHVELSKMDFRSYQARILVHTFPVRVIGQNRRSNVPQAETPRSMIATPTSAGHSAPSTPKNVGWGFGDSIKRATTPTNTSKTAIDNLDKSEERDPTPVVELIREESLQQPVRTRRTGSLGSQTSVGSLLDID